MKMVFTADNRFIVANAKNILESHAMNVVLRNEYASSAIGEVSPFDTWLEVWVINDSDYDAACQILDSSLSKEGAPSWVCTNCQEENDASFEMCWHCQSDHPSSAK
jgi:hypothetical protein